MCHQACTLDNHAGDSQTLTVTAALRLNAGRWSAVPLETSGFVGQGVFPPLTTIAGDHVQVFLSPGKHHFYPSADPNGVYEVGAINYNCDDPHDGSVGPIVYDALKPVPVEPGPSNLLGVPASACGFNLCDSVPWVNACARARQGVLVASTHFGTPGVGMAGCDFFDESFCDGAQVGSVVEAMSWGKPDYDDIDDDHVANAIDPCPTLVDDPGHPHTENFDDDGFPDDCDPDRFHQNSYVGKGGVRSDGVVVKGTVAKLTPGTPFVPKGALGGGYADFDGDNVADGNDLCPSNASVTADINVASEWQENDWNQYGMAIDLSIASDPLKARIIGAQTGYAYRANQCDPYPASRTTASPNAVPGTTHFCKGLEAIELGGSRLPIETQVFVGKSANDLTASSDRTYMFAPQRCNCGDRADCLTNQDDACFKGKTLPEGAFLWQGWRTAYFRECSLKADGYCAGAARTVPQGSVKTLSSRWYWAEERVGFSDHFRPDSFSFEAATPTSSAYATSVDKYAIGMLAEQGADFTSPPGSLLAYHPTTSLYAEPDTGPDGSSLKIHIAANEESRRLRVSRFETLIAPWEEHVALISAGSCLPPWHGDLSFLDDPVLELGDLRNPILERGNRLVVGRAGAKLGDVAVLDGAANRRRNVVPGPTVPGWLRDGSGAFSVLHAGRDWVVPSGGEVATRFVPSAGLFWVEQGIVGAARWAMLAATSQTDTTVTYSVVRDGVAPFLFSRSGLVVTDARVGTVAVLDPSTGLVASYDPEARAWSQSDSAAVRRSGASYVLDGTTLFVAGGSVGGVASTSVALIDVRDGTGFERAGFPARIRPVLTLARDAHVLVFGGGAGVDGRVRDDVWTLDTASPIATARQFRSESVGGALESGKALLDVSISSNSVAAYFQTDDGWTEARTRVEGGWRGTDSSASSPACKPDDATGGQLCILPGSSAWSSPGRITCATDVPSHACQGAVGEVLATRTLSAPRHLDADVSNGMLWTLSKRSVERRRLAADLSDAGVNAIGLGANARDIAAGEDGALIATDAGFAWVGTMATTVAVATACGKAVRVENVGASRWVGVTTLSLVSISTESGQPRITAEALLLPRRGNDGLELTRLPRGAAGRLLCLASERAIGTRAADELGDATSLAAVDDGEFLVGRGPVLGRLQARGGDFEIAGWALSPGGIEQLRFDAEGRRAYATTKHGERVFDLRGSGLSARAGAGVANWIRRVDASDISVVSVNSELRLARVSR